ncbi:MAG: T9SS type A sorting domain-containing protein, partial [Chitinophagales bacterium]|nr:T9SS type A sorting domain-containing protein [Chitinophagales bacterium]
DKMLLKYSLQTATDVTVEIVNELKQVVASYSLQKQNAGNHNYYFDVKNFTEGNYFIQFYAAQQIVTNKFTVVH